MPLPALTFLPLEGDLAELRRAGARRRRGRPDPRRRTAAACCWPRPRTSASGPARHLGLGKPPPPGRRPKTNLAGIATSVGWALHRRRPLPSGCSTSASRPPSSPSRSAGTSSRPAFLHLDPGERFPRVTVRGAEGAPAGLFGPFRDRASAEKARDAVNRLFPLRPCDYVVRARPGAAPRARVPLRPGAVVRRPLSRPGERGGLPGAGGAGRRAGWPSPATRADAARGAARRPWRASKEARAVVVGVGRREVELYPVRAGRVLEEAAA